MRKQTAIPRYQAIMQIILLFSAVFVSSARGEEFSAVGEIETTNNHDVHALSENHVVLLVSMQERLVLDDQASPWHEATGPCGGAVEIKNGIVSGSGLCAFTDKKGDKFVISWTAESMNEQGGPVGIWSLTDGTGQYAGAEANGEYSDVPSEDPKFSTVLLTGNLVLAQ